MYLLAIVLFIAFATANMIAMAIEDAANNRDVAQCALVRSTIWAFLSALWSMFIIACAVV